MKITSKTLKKNEKTIIKLIIKLLNDNIILFKYCKKMRI